MANGPGQGDKALALAMLERMGDSERELTDIRARAAAGEGGSPRLAAAAHQARLQPLFQAEIVETVELPATAVAIMEHVADRDLLSCREEFIEKALAAYISQHPRGAEGLPEGWQTTVASARAEVEGQTQGAFGPGLVATLANLEQREQYQQAALERLTRDRSNDRENQ